MPLPGHGAMRLTTARYYTPSGRSIQAKGIDPDIIVKQARIETLDAPKRRFESDLRNALDNGEDAKGKNPGDGKATKDTPQDYQLARALDLLRGVSLFSSKAVTTN